jgi:endonuclease YncB( thermonuclease family)
MTATYPARVLDVIDGDTLDVVVDLDLQMRRVLTLRLDGVDTHETYGVDEDSEEYQRGARETEYVREWLPDGSQGEWPLTVSISERGKFGRHIATVERGDGAVLNDDLRERFEGVTA